MELPFIVTLQPDELLYSFVLRLMKANGFDSLFNFIQNCISPEKHRLSYDVGYDLYNFLDIIGYEDIQSFYLNTTIYSGIYPLVDKTTASSYFSKRPNKPMINELKFCPMCKAEDEIFYYHRAHQMPGVTVCYKHGCVLNTYIGQQNKEFEEPVRYITNKVYKKSLEYAIFTKGLLDKGIQISLEDTLKLIPNDIDYDSEMKEYLELINESPNNFLSSIRITAARYSKEILLVILLFLYKNVSNLVTHINYKTYKIDNDYELLSSYRNDLVEVKCLKCNSSFLAVPGKILCYNCYRKNSLNNNRVKLTTTPKTLPKEFELVNKSTNSIYGVFKHKLCGNTFRCNYYNFLRRPKCKICETIPKAFLNNTNQNINELTIGINQLESIYNWIKDNFNEDDIIFSEEIVVNNLPRSVITDNVKKYVKRGLLKSLDRGIYSFPNTSFSTDKIISEKFVKRRNNRIGYYCGEAFLYEIGLIKEKPERITIVTNMVETLHGRSVYIDGVEVRIYGSRVKITDKNYAILAVIRFFINQKRCDYKVNGNYYYDIYKWLDSLGIKLSDFEEYYSYFQDWIKGRIRNVYKEGELCEG